MQAKKTLLERGKKKNEVQRNKSEAEGAHYLDTKKQKQNFATESWTTSQNKQDDYESHGKQCL